MGVKAQPRKLLNSVEGLSLVELAEPEICCGFGGTFCVKYPDISVRMVTDKCRDIQATGAGTLLAGDMGCLLNMAGRLKREGSSVKVRHVAEVLAGMTRDAAPIGEGRLNYSATAKGRMRLIRSSAVFTPARDAPNPMAVSACAVQLLQLLKT
jgi:L-lactate dehydrogenase complex protein LldE